jgi:nucleotide-binding universal stress UspA family protein
MKPGTGVPDGGGGPGSLSQVLVVIDGSETDDQALARGIETVRESGGRLHVVLPLDLEAYSDRLDAGDVEREGERVVAEATERATDAGLADVEGHLLTGSADRAVESYAREADVDLIMVGGTEDPDPDDRLSPLLYDVGREVRVPLLMVTDDGADE